MKQTSINTPATACLSALLLATPMALAQVPDEVVLEDLLGARNVRTRTVETPARGARSIVTFEGFEGLTYDVEYCSSDVWTGCGTATVSDGRGLYIEEVPTNGPRTYDVILSLRGDSAPPVFPQMTNLQARLLPGGAVQVRWTPATDDHRVLAYGIYLKDVILTSYSASRSNAVIEGLPADSIADLSLVAVDEHGNVTHANTAPLSIRKHIDQATPLLNITARKRPGRGFMDVNGDNQLTPLDALVTANKSTDMASSDLFYAAANRSSLRPGWTDRIYRGSRAPRTGLPAEGPQATPSIFGGGRGTALNFQSSGDVAAEYVDKYLPFFDW